jgi:mono/diheme cytochrome c family protein
LFFADGGGGNGGPSLKGTGVSMERALAQIRNGGGGMPAFKGTLTEPQIRDVAAYVVERIAG